MYNKPKHLFKYFFVLSTLVLLGACKTTKNKFLNRSYHNTTTRYNWYFNANESFKSGVKKLETEHKDDFNELLKIYPLEQKKKLNLLHTNGQSVEEMRQGHQ